MGIFYGNCLHTLHLKIASTDRWRNMLASIDKAGR